jgi:hypothetical protein
MLRSSLHLILVLLLLASASPPAQAQQPADCLNCTTCLPAAGGTLSVRTTQFAAVVCGAAPVNFGTAINNATFIQFNVAAAQANNVYTFSTCSSIAENTVMYITNAPPSGAPTQLFACDDDGCGAINGRSTITVKLAAAAYRLYVRRNDCATLRLFNTQVQISCQAPTAPINDEPCGAIDLMPVASPTCSYTAGTTVGATQSSSQFNPIFPQLFSPVCFAPNTTGNFNGGDVWFRVTVPPSGRIAIETEELGICAGAFAVYQATGSCGAWGSWSNLFPLSPTGVPESHCVLNSPTNLVGDPARHFTGLAPGSVIYIRYWERSNNEPGTFRICAYEPDPAPGDEPCVAAVLATPSTCNFQGFSLDRTGPLYGATLSPVTPSCGVVSSTVQDMWFRVVVTADMLTYGLSVNTEAGTLTDMAMAWYTLTAGTCGPPSTLELAQIACNDNQSAGNLMPRINTNVGLPALGQSVYIRVWASTWGSFSICARANQPPVNDNPCGAIALPTTFGGCNYLAATNEVATPTGTTFAGGTVTTPTCGGVGPFNADVWYTVVVPPNGQVRISTQAGELGQAAMQLYQASGTNCPTLTLTALPVLACNSPGGGMPILSVNLVAGTYAGQTLYLRVWRRTGADGTFGICSFRTDAPDASCPDVSTDAAGPNANYGNNENFSQTFCPSSATEVVHLNFSQFNTEEGLDFLEIRDGSTVASPCIGRFSGNTLPPQFVSSTPGGCLTIRFTSNANGTRPGWVAAVSCVPAPPENQCSITISDQGGQCGNYGNSVNEVTPPGSLCAPAGQVPIINFTSFNMAAGDFVTVFDGDNAFAACLGTFSGNSLPPTLAGTVLGGCITVQLTSNGSGTAGGYVARVRYGTPPTVPTAINAPPSTSVAPVVASAVTTCSARIFDSGGACGQYQDNEDVTVTYCATAGQYLSITFQSFDLENTYDFLRIYNGPTTGSPSLGTFTGVNSPGVVTSTVAGGCITLRFTSDFSETNTGWTASLSCSPTAPTGPPPVVGLCNSTVYDPGGASGNYINNIGNASPIFGTSQPLWTQTYCPTAPATSLNIEFLSFSVEANYDALYIYNGPNTGSPLFSSGNPQPTVDIFGGNPVLGPGGWWGTTLPGTFTSTHPSGCLTLALTSDEILNNPGWSALITCNGPVVPPPPPADCVYLLRLFDACGDGWGGSDLEVSINGGAVSRYTLPSGGFAQYEIPMDVNDTFTYTYNATGPNSGDNSFTFVREGSAFAAYISGSPIPVGPLAVTVDCEIPVAPPEDCVGAITLCNTLSFTSETNHTGNFADLNSGNRGCLSTNERQGRWYVFSAQATGNIGFTLKPQNPLDDYNFAVYGPFPAGTNTNTICPLLPPLATTTPIRCSFASRANTVTANTAAGLGAVNWTGMGNAAPAFAPQFAPLLPVANEAVAGDGWVSGMQVTAGQVFIMYLSNASGSGQGTTLEWTLTGGANLDCTILPVELLSFDADAKPAHVDVLWSTATERNSAWFDVQRSADGERFVDLGRVGAAGESQSPLDYLFKDMDPLEGMSYYRLNQVDRDGQSTFSDVVPVLYRRDPRALEVYPNPADANIRVQFDMPDDGPVRWRISDASGRVALLGNTGGSKGRNGFDIDLQVLDAGTYTLQLMDQHGGPVGTARFVKR